MYSAMTGFNNPWWWLTYTETKCRHFDEIVITGNESCNLITSSAANDKNSIKMTTFAFQWTS